MEGGEVKNKKFWSGKEVTGWDEYVRSLNSKDKKRGSGVHRREMVGKGVRGQNILPKQDTKNYYSFEYKEIKRFNLL